MLPVAHKGASCVGKLARLKLGRCQKKIVAHLVTSKNRCHPRGDRRSAGVGLYPPTFGVVANMVGKLLILSATVTGGGDDDHMKILTSPRMPARIAPDPGGGEEKREKSVFGSSALTFDPKRKSKKIFSCHHAHRPLPAGAVSGQILNSDQTACLCHVSHLNQPIRFKEMIPSPVLPRSHSLLYTAQRHLSQKTWLLKEGCVSQG